MIFCRSKVFTNVMWSDRDLLGYWISLRDGRYLSETIFTDLSKSNSLVEAIKKIRDVP